MHQNDYEIDNAPERAPAREPAMDAHVPGTLALRISYIDRTGFKIEALVTV